MKDTDSFLDDMISSWLQQADQVATKSGVPTWRSLAKALKHKLLGQNGIASQILKDKSKEMLALIQALHSSFMLLAVHGETENKQRN